MNRFESYGSPPPGGVRASQVEVGQAPDAILPQPWGAVSRGNRRYSEIRPRVDSRASTGTPRPRVWPLVTRPTPWTSRRFSASCSALG